MSAIRVCLLPLLISLIFSPVLAQPKSGTSDIVYEVFVQSYCDSNGDGIGDLPGLISKLDYIRDLGVHSIWMMPVHPSPSYHKYDVIDFYGIHPDYGTMADMDRLIREAHQRGMKVILDLVVNHTSDQHPWFVASSSAPSNPYRPYYVWKDFDAVKDEIEKKSTTFDSDNLTQWHTFTGQEERYYGFFWKGMPDLNFDYPPVREAIYKIGKFWLEKGIDGFRLDAAKHIYPDDRLDDTRLFWEEFTRNMKAIKPDVKIIGEVWADSHILSNLFKGLPSLFNFEMTRAIPDCIQAHDPMLLINPYRAILKAYTDSGEKFEDAILLSNHDMNRIRSTLGGDLAKAKLAAAILLTLPGTPYIYYGEEIGMLGVKPDKYLREPFLWSDRSASDTSWLKPHFSKRPDVIPLDEQQKDAQSIYQFYKKWIGLRNAHPALQQGAIDFIPPEFPHVLAYMRTTKKERLMVIHNLDEKELEVRIMDPFESLDPAFSRHEENKLLLPAFGSVVLDLKSK